ncbi:MAG: CZB domain-containing protein [Fuscovulum sp.]|nr:CZB domain-containing protein [Fuscovulum sp.]
MPNQPNDLEPALRAAMEAHARWRLRLKTALTTRRSDIPVEQAACDDRCEFGKWLHDPSLDPAIRDSQPYRVVRRLHAEFHKVAADALEGALNGQRRRRDRSALAEFDGSSSKLMTALQKWLGEVRG